MLAIIVSYLLVLFIGVAFGTLRALSRAKYCAHCDDYVIPLDGRYQLILPKIIRA